MKAQWLLAAVAFIAECGLMSAQIAGNIVFDDTPGYGRSFDGIGGISGGGATSKLLINYPQQQRDEILDYLFRPNFGASLHILKVEIGGDIQSTDGTEASHMHSSWDENYERGYEWWLMLEAKKRNPDIKLYALPWGFPGWIGQGKGTPYANNAVLADYVFRWINGAKTHYNLTIDFIGIWNERNYDINYIKTLRNLLDQKGFQNTLIVASDGGWDIAGDIKKDGDLAKAVYAIGCHYPGTWSSGDAQSSQKVLWASEDYSTFNNEVGAGCWARILNQNYVNGLMTSTISWNLIASYYQGLPYFRDGLMTAVQPWSGNYIVQSPIWISAHTTQFASIGWKYLSYNNGVGKLPNGGSYVALVSPSGSDLTIILETMSHDHSICIRPSLNPYSVSAQNVTITLKGHFANITHLYVWHSILGFGGAESSMFNRLAPLQFVNGTAVLSLGVDEIFTLTTLPGGQKGSYPPSPPPRSFPLPYKDNFESYNLYEEPFNLAQQTGSFEILSDGTNKFVRQTVLDSPLAWCNAENINKAFNIIGENTWADIMIEVDFTFPSVNATSGVFLAARIDNGGCDVNNAKGVFLFITQDNKFIVALDPEKNSVLLEGTVTGGPGWHRLSLYTQGVRAFGAYDRTGLFSIDVMDSPIVGYAGLGTDSFGLADFDNLYIASSETGKSMMRKYFAQPPPQPLYFVQERN